HVRQLRTRLDQQFKSKNLLAADGSPLMVRWNSPPDAIPHIVNLSVPGFPSGPLTRMLEERGCIVSSVSACTASRSDPDPVLKAMGLPPSALTSAIRVSFSGGNQLGDVDQFVSALHASIQQMAQLLGGGGAGHHH
ncbi:MAG: hypothetical protein AAB425_12190, partial [Bdellovibrionota bacterium]